MSGPGQLHIFHLRVLKLKKKKRKRDCSRGLNLLLVGEGRANAAGKTSVQQTCECGTL